MLVMSPVHIVVTTKIKHRIERADGRCNEAIQRRTVFCFVFGSGWCEEPIYRRANWLNVEPKLEQGEDWCHNVIDEVEDYELRLRH